jgi:hypothetical protein
MDAFSRDIALSPMTDFSPRNHATSRKSISRPQSLQEKVASLDLDDRGRHRFKSYRLKGTLDKPWQADPRMKKTSVGNWIMRVCIIIGFALAAYINFFNYQSVAKHDVGAKC